MMAGNPNWWSMNGMHPHDHQHEFVYGSSDSNSSLSSSSIDTAAVDHHHGNQDFPPVRSWSQLLMGGLGVGENNQEEEKFGGSLFQQQQKKLEINWEDQVLNLNPISSNFTRQLQAPVIDVKQEVVAQSTSQLYHDHNHDQYRNNPNWLVNSPPNSCTTTLSNNILNFSGGKPAAEGKNHHHKQDHSSDQCNNTNSGGVTKKPRVQQSSAQPALKVRKEKLGDRITALHQLVSPFGKTDTASVLSEAIGYIRFLQGQIEALSSPYMCNGSGSTVHQYQHSVQERNCLFPEEGAGQFLNNNDHMGMEGRGAPKQDHSQSRGLKDLKSRGLCLVPISCTQNVGNDTGADYWAPSALGGGF